MSNPNLFAPPTKEELESVRSNNMFAPPTKEELEQFKESEPDTSILEAAKTFGLEGASSGLDDELGGALEAAGQFAGVKGLGAPNISETELQSPVGFDYEKLLNAYQTARDRRRSIKEQQRTDRPGTALAANIAGGLATGLKLPMSLPSLAAQGAASGAGMSEADLTRGDVGQFALDTGLGAGVGAGLGKIAPMAGSVPLKTGVAGAAIGAGSELLDDEFSGEELINKTLSGGLIGAGVGLAGAPLIKGAKSAISRGADFLTPIGKTAYKKAATPAGQAMVDVRTPEFQNDFMNRAKNSADDATSVISGVKQERENLAQSALDAFEVQKNMELENINGLLAQTEDEFKNAKFDKKNELKAQINQLKNQKKDIIESIKTNIDNDIAKQEAAKVEKQLKAEAEFENKRQAELLKHENKINELNKDLENFNDAAKAKYESESGSQRLENAKKYSDYQNELNKKLKDEKKVITDDLTSIYTDANKMKFKFNASDVIDEMISPPSVLPDGSPNPYMPPSLSEAQLKMLEEYRKDISLNDLRNIKEKLFSVTDSNQLSNIRRFASLLHKKLGDAGAEALNNLPNSNNLGTKLKDTNRRYYNISKFDDDFANFTEAGIAKDKMDRLIKVIKTSKSTPLTAAQEESVGNAINEAGKLIPIIEEINPDIAKFLVAAAEDLNSVSTRIDKLSPEVNTTIPNEIDKLTAVLNDLKKNKNIDPTVLQEAAAPYDRELSRLDSLLKSVKKPGFDPNQLNQPELSNQISTIKNQIKELNFKDQLISKDILNRPEIVSEAAPLVEKLNRLKELQKQVEQVQNRKIQPIPQTDTRFSQFKSDDADEISKKFLSYIEQAYNKDNNFPAQQELNRFFDDIERTKGPEFKAQLQQKMKDLAADREVYAPDLKIQDVFTVPGIARTAIKGQATAGAFLGKAVKKAYIEPMALITDTAGKLTDSLIARIDTQDKTLAKMLDNVRKMPPAQQQRSMFAIMQNPVWRNKINQDQEPKK